MEKIKTQNQAPWKAWLVSPARTTMAAVLALVAARALGLREVWWAVMSALVVVRSDFGSSVTNSWHRLAGTALGALGGALLAAHFGPGVIVFALGVFGICLLSVALRLERPADRFAAVALSFVLLAARAGSAWVLALHRFLEVSTGIGAGLILSALWPEQQPRRDKILVSEELTKQLNHQQQP